MKKLIYKLLKKIGLFNILKQLKIDYISKFKRDINIEFINLSNMSYKNAGNQLAIQYKNDILQNLPSSYDKKTILAYEKLKKIDKNFIDELESITNNLGIDKYLLLSKELAFEAESCTSFALKNNTNKIIIGQNLDLGYNGKDLIVKKYKDYITIGLKSHPLWSTVGINKFGITYSGSSVCSQKMGGSVLPSILNSKIILSNAQSLDDVINFFANNKFYVGNDTGSYIFSDNEKILYIECDAKNFYYEYKNLAYTTNKFINMVDNNLFINQHYKNDAIKREIFFNKTLNNIDKNIDSAIKLILSHDAHICAHSIDTARYTTCSIIIDKSNKKFYFTKQLPCKLRNINKWLKIDLDFK